LYKFQNQLPAVLIVVLCTCFAWGNRGWHVFLCFLAIQHVRIQSILFVDARVSESFTFDFSKKSIFSLRSVCLRLTDFIENGFKVFRIVQDCKNLLTNIEGKAYRKKL